MSDSKEGKEEKKQGKASPIAVQTHAGYKQDEQPRSFELDGKKFSVLSVKQTWKEESEEGRRRKVFFRVHTHDGKNHDIAMDENTGEWTLEPFSSGRG